jgi:NAD(P)-dependent dehydrogenase (short-subunit alcohol dehydrogenase family)
MIDLTGKTCIVTGSTKGVGRAVAQEMARAGADLVVSARTASDVEVAAAELDRGVRGRVIGIPADVSRVEDCLNLIETTVEEFGRVDVLVNNAGIGVFKSIAELSIEEWQNQVDTNLGGVFYCSKAAVPHLRASGGWIVNIGSLACRNSFPGGSGYNASKFGLLGMTEAMMLDLRHDGIRVSIIMPGSINTAFNDREPGPDRAWALGSEDCAAAVMHILSYPQNALVSRVEMRPSQPPKR